MSKIELLIDYLKHNCVGYENRQKAYKLMKVINIKDHKTFRNIIETIRQSDENVFICSEAGSNGGYWIPINKQEIKITIEHLEKRASEMLKTARILRKKSGIKRWLDIV